jgi:hypothetical protein
MFSLSERFQVTVDLVYQSAGCTGKAENCFFRVGAKKIFYEKNIGDHFYQPVGV